ncbi:hypothetical protein JKP88DRAFT_353084 [Tribonema minus]|uniref:Uncharacterized protein n=1 Tax=Tribonema minus TaxID=303371 RepID=A0A836CL53_9STRA|nr:hypothetical protein JKP88DRAFT_353084 [Tribonema minus]
MASAVDSIDSSSLALNQALEGDELVARDCFAEFTCMGTAGVLGMSYNGDGTDLEQRLEELVLDCSGLSDDAATGRIGYCLRAILTFYQRVYNRRPVFVIDINSKMEPAALSDLLLAARQLGFQEKLATFIFVVSASRSALGLTVGITQSRVRGYRAPDFNPAEAHNYLAKHLSPFPELTEFVVQQVGTRAMDLVEVCSGSRGVESELECRERVEAYRTARIDDARDALDGFVAIAEENAAFSKDASLAFFKKLLAGTSVLKDKDARVAFGFKKPDLLLAALAQWHAFAVDPFDHTISMQSHFMQIAVDQYLQAEALGAAGTSEPSSA